ncbi:hypothetical protein ATANTOWER_014494, partial [Ataeniobius toweri]|nr:hypothetical protein [Ataeniobius toweri]
FFVCWPVMLSNTMAITAGIGTLGSFQVLLESKISIFVQLVSRRKHILVQLRLCSR